MPNRFAMRQLKLSYLDKVQQEATAFLQERIKHDFLRPERELTLDLSIAEAELLASANESVRAQAESGALKEIHARFNNAQARAGSEYFAIREQLAKTLQIIEAKENEIYSRLLDGEFGEGFHKVKLHGQSSPLVDLLSLATGDISFSNLSIVEGAISNGHESAEQLKNVQGWLHSFMGIKHEIFKLETTLKEAFCNHVSHGEEEESLSRDEFKNYKASRDAYGENFSRQEVAPFAQSDYDAFVGQIKELAEGRGKSLINDFKEYEQAFTARKNVYDSFTTGSSSEAMQAFRTDLLQHLAGSIVVKEHRQRYQKE